MDQSRCWTQPDYIVSHIALLLHITNGVRYRISVAETASKVDEMLVKTSHGHEKHQDLIRNYDHVNQSRQSWFLSFFSLGPLVFSIAEHLGYGKRLVVHRNIEYMTGEYPCHLDVQYCTNYSSHSHFTHRPIAM